jgi:Ca2+-binding EF-hand superfamily protein
MPRMRIPMTLTVLLLAPVLALSQVKATGEYLQRMDTDGDGRVALGEYQDWMSYAFDRMDANADGVLVPSEMPGGRGKASTREQFRQRLALTFGRQDANRDGFLDARELASPPQ